MFKVELLTGPVGWISGIVVAAFTAWLKGRPALFVVRRIAVGNRRRHPFRRPTHAPLLHEGPLAVDKG